MHWSLGFIALAAYGFYIWRTWPRSNHRPSRDTPTGPPTDQESA